MKDSFLQGMKVGGPWVQFLLGETFFSVSEKRLRNFTVAVGTRKNSTIFVSVEQDVIMSNITEETSLEAISFRECARNNDTVPSGVTAIISCHTTERGRYVRIQLNEEGILTLCEVQVHGVLIPGKY